MKFLLYEISCKGVFALWPIFRLLGHNLQLDLMVSSGCQEAKNASFYPSEEKFHTAVLLGVRNTPDAL